MHAVTPLGIEVVNGEPHIHLHNSWGERVVTQQDILLIKGEVKVPVVNNWDRWQVPTQEFK